MKRASICPAALLALPLATALVGHAAASVDYEFTVNPTLDLTEAFLFVTFPLGTIDVVELGSFTAGNNQDFAFTDDSFSADENRLVFLSVYEENVNGQINTGLNVSLIDLGTTFTEDPTFDELFGSFFDGQDFAGLADVVDESGQVTSVEDQVIADLRTSEDLLAGPAPAFASGFAFPRFSVDSPILGFDESTEVNLGNFSTLSNGGTLEVIVNGIPIPVIPEPASVALLGLGSLMLAGRRRRVSA